MPRLLCWILLALVAVAGVFPFMQKGTSELPVYLLGAERFLQGLELYQPADIKPFTYPPFFALPFVPLALVPDLHGEGLGVTWDLRRAIWWFANVAMVWWLVRAVGRWFRPQLEQAAPRIRVWFWVLILALAGRHMWSVLSNQSHDMIVLLLVAMGVDMWRRAREVDGGALIGVAAACKATPLLFLGPFVLSGRIWSAMACCLAVVGCVLLPDMLVSRQDGTLHVIAWYETFLSGLDAGGAADAQGAWTPHTNLNQSLSGTLHRLWNPVGPETIPSPRIHDIHIADLGPSGTKVLDILGKLFVLGVIALVAWRRGGPGTPALLAWRRTGIAAMSVCGMVLLSPMSSKSHFCVLLLPAAFCALSWLRSRERVLGGLLAAWFVLGTLLSKGLLGWRTASGARAGDVVLAYGPVTWAAMVALLATGHAVFYGLGAPLEDDPPA